MCASLSLTVLTIDFCSLFSVPLHRVFLHAWLRLRLLGTGRCQAATDDIDNVSNLQSVQCIVALVEALDGADMQYDLCDAT